MKTILAVLLCVSLALASDPWNGIGGGLSSGISFGGGFGLGGHGLGALSRSFILPVPEIGLTFSKIPILLPLPTIVLRKRPQLVSKPVSVPLDHLGFGGLGGLGLGGHGFGFGHSGGISLGGLASNW